MLFSRTRESALTQLDARRICVIKPSALGDIVQTLPLLPVLRARFPRAKISWVVNRELSDLLAEHPHIETLLPFERRGSWQSWRKLLGDLRRSRFDLVFDLQGLLRSAVMTLATRAPLRVGLETAREGAHLACHYHLPDTGRQVPAHQRYWRLAEILGLGDLHPEPQIAIRPEHTAWANGHLHGLERPLMAIHPGAGWRTKQWPVEKFASVAAKASRRYGFSIVLVGSPGERLLAAQIEHLVHRFSPAAHVVNLSGETSLRQLAAVLKQVDVLLTNDSGPMHLAAGLGTSVVGVFTCTSALRSGPPGRQHELVSTQVSCAASYRKKCPLQGQKHMACMDELSIERVWRAFVRLVDRRAAQPSAA